MSIILQSDNFRFVNRYQQLNNDAKTIGNKSSNRFLLPQKEGVIFVNLNRKPLTSAYGADGIKTAYLPGGPGAVGTAAEAELTKAGADLPRL